MSSSPARCLRLQTVVDLRKESKACRHAGRERRRVLREGESLRVAAPEPFTPDSASSMEQVRRRRYAGQPVVHSLPERLRVALWSLREAAPEALARTYSFS